jgi:hypothetical protein
VSKNETTHIGESRAIDETDPSTRHHKDIDRLDVLLYYVIFLVMSYVFHYFCNIIF